MNPIHINSLKSNELRLSHRPDIHDQRRSQSIASCDELSKANRRHPQPKVNPDFNYQVGPSLDKKLNFDIWMNLEEVMHQLKQHTSLYPIEGLKYVTVDSALVEKGIIDHSVTQTTLFIVLLNLHYYAILYDACTRTAWGSDGGNILANDSEVREELTQLLGCRLRAIDCGIQSGGLEHSGSYAVGVALELMRLYRRQDLEDGHVGIRKKLVQQIIKKKQIGKSHPRFLKLPIHKKNFRYVCRYCKTRSFYQKTAVLLHEMKCRLKNDPNLNTVIDDSVSDVKPSTSSSIDLNAQL